MESTNHPKLPSNSTQYKDMVPSVNADPLRGYARYSYDHEPPERPGFKVTHVKRHKRGSVWVPDRWFYLRVDADGVAYRGRLARERMVADGIAPPQIVSGPVDAEQLSQHLQTNPSPARKRAKGIKPKRTLKHRRTKTEMLAVRQREIDAALPMPKRASSAMPIGHPDSIWVPVRGAGELVHGWMDIAYGMYVMNEQLQPEGLLGRVRRDATLIFTENFQDMLASLQKVK